MRSPQSSWTAGTFNVIDGIVAPSKFKFHVVAQCSGSATFGRGADRLLLGIVQIGVAFASSSAVSSPLVRDHCREHQLIAQLMFIEAYPWRALAIFTLASS